MAEKIKKIITSDSKQLSAKGLEIFCPQCRTIMDWSDALKRINVFDSLIEENNDLKLWKAGMLEIEKQYIKKLDIAERKIMSGYDNTQA